MYPRAQYWAHSCTCCTLLQYHYSADDVCLAKSRVEHCAEEIDRWMISNKLKLIDDKTELIIFSSKFPRSCLSNVQISVESVVLSIKILL